MTQCVGIVGMGLMGQAFILNLRKSGFDVQGFDVDPARMDDLKGMGRPSRRLPRRRGPGGASYAEKDTVSFIEMLRIMAGLDERGRVDGEPLGRPFRLRFLSDKKENLCN